MPPSVKTWYNTTNTCRENELYSTVYSAEKDGEEVKPIVEGIRNVPPQHMGETPQIRSPVVTSTESMLPLFKM